jgi:glycosyltransferase involved in cell wall biosynthesis
MTAYNRQLYIGEAIESVLASTYQNWELIIVDDCSKDDTVAIAKSYEETDKQIKVYINEKNLGDYPNRNKAASYSKGDFLMYCDSDDQLFPESVSKAVSSMLLFPEANYGLNSPVNINGPMFFDTKEIIRKHFFETPIFMFGPGATIIKKEFFEHIEGFPEKYGPANDMFYHLKVASQTGVVLIPFNLINYRRHGGQEINNQESYLYNNYLYLNDALKELNLPLKDNERNYLDKKNKRRFSVNLFKYFLQTGSIRKSKVAFLKADFNTIGLKEGLFHYLPNMPKP